VPHHQRRLKRQHLALDLGKSQEPELRDLAVLILRTEVLRELEVVDAHRFGLHAFRDFTQHAHRPARDRLARELRGDAGFFPGLFHQRCLSREADADATRHQVVEHARIDLLARAAAREPHALARDAVQVHRLRGQAERPRRGALDLERVGDAVALVAPAGDEAFLGELLDDRRKQICFEQLYPVGRSGEHLLPFPQPGGQLGPQPADALAPQGQGHEPLGPEGGLHQRILLL